MTNTTATQRLRERIAQLRDDRKACEATDEAIIARNGPKMFEELDENNVRRETLKRQLLACEIALAAALDGEANANATNLAEQLAKAEQQLRATAAERVERAVDIGKIIAQLRLAVLKYEEADNRAHMQGQRFCRRGPFTTLRAPQRLYIELQKLLARQDIPDPVRELRRQQQLVDTVIDETKRPAPIREEGV